MNILADQLSRPDLVLLTEWSLLWVFTAIYREYGVSFHRSFLTRVNTKLPLYVFPIPDPMAWKEDDFQHSWDDLSVYAFPPFTLLRQILLSVLISWKLSIILVAPLWPQKEWFANIISLLLDAARASSAVELASLTS